MLASPASSLRLSSGPRLEVIKSSATVSHFAGSMATIPGWLCRAVAARVLFLPCNVCHLSTIAATSHSSKEAASPVCSRLVSWCLVLGGECPGPGAVHSQNLHPAVLLHFLAHRRLHSCASQFSCWLHSGNPETTPASLPRNTINLTLLTLATIVGPSACVHRGAVTRPPRALL
jgi:hypothetical protein